MLTVIRRARRRLLANELFSQAANTFSAAFAAFILLLLIGTELLRWEWLLLLPAAAVGAGVYFALRRLPGEYATAQILDRRLGLADSLSTAWFFSRDSRSSAEGMIAGQREQALRLAESADIQSAIPFRIPRTAYTMAVLGLVASSLFALRYGITKTLDLHPPLARILEQQFGFEPKTVLAKNVRPDPPPPGHPEAADDDTVPQNQEQAGEPEPSPDQNPDNAADRSADKKGPGNRGDAQKQTQDAEQQSNADEQGEADQQESASDPRGGNPGQQANRKSDQGKQSNSQRDANGSNESSSLMTKVKDALQNLLSRVKPQQSAEGSQQAADQKGNQQQNKGQQNSGKQESAKNGQRGDSGQQGDAQEGQTGDKAENAPDPQGKASGKSDGQQNSKQPGSGIGSQDGDKSIKQAEQLAAMGKISEIIGKRSANITGEATVDVQSTSQQLKTPYAQRGAQHTQTGAEIDRDEIPVALQAYIEKYFEQVRKQAPPKK